VDLVSKKWRSIKALNRILAEYPLDLGENMLEVGGGSGWASCLIKSKYPKTRIVLTDISKQSLEQVDVWERHFGAGPDEVMVMDAKALRFADASFDSVLVFASLHHMHEKEETLSEMHRVLQPGGTLMVLYEPSYPSFWLVRENGKYLRCREEDGYVSPKRYLQLLGATGFSPRMYEYDQGPKEGVISRIAKGFKISLRPSSLVILAKKS